MLKIFVTFMTALAVLLMPTSPASAQSFPKPPDVPAYVPMTPTYASGTTLNVIGDGSATGGVPPANSYELVDAYPTTESGWSLSVNSPACLAGDDGPNPPGVLCPEAKFRTRTSGDVKILYDDPIRNYGKPGTSHCHEFFGNQSANAYSTFHTLRKNARKRSWAAGGPLNGTAYWFPCVIKTNPFGNGKNYAVVPNRDIIIYYTNSPAQSIKTTRLPLGLRYVGGYDMDNGQTWLQGLIDTANAQSGTAGRYRKCATSGTPTHYWSAFKDCGTFFSFRCVLNDGTGEKWADGWKEADGSDPWGGKCTAGQDMWIQFGAPVCWDGVNLWSPGGYKHVIPKIYDTVAAKMVCPNGWYNLPELVLQIHFAHNGFSDYGTWKLASDDAAGTLPGRSFHTDWMGAWNRQTLSTWLSYCIAIGNEGNTQPHECDGSNISDTEQLLTTGTAPTGRGPQTGTMFNADTSTPNGMKELPTQQNGPGTIHTHAGGMH